LKKSKLIFLGIAILFFIGLGLIVVDFNRKTTFPGASEDNDQSTVVDSLDLDSLKFEGQ